MDVYGSTTAITFVREESVPVEVLSRGREAVDAFIAARAKGTLPIYRGKLVLLGQDGVGKSSLKKALLGEEDPLCTVPTEGVDATSWCWASVDGTWTPGGTSESMTTVQRPTTSSTSNFLNTSITLSTLKEDYSQPNTAKEDHYRKRSSNEDCSNLSPLKEDLKGWSNLKEDYNNSLATNVAKELLMVQGKRRRGFETKEEKKETTARGRKRSISSVIRTNQVNCSKSRELSRSFIGKRNKIVPSEKSESGEIPENIVTIVESLLSQDQVKDCWNRDVSCHDPWPAVDPLVALHIWDLGGHPSLYTSHQLYLTERAVYVLVLDLRQGLDSPATLPTWKRDQAVYTETELTNLDFILLWLNLIYLSGSSSSSCGQENASSVIIVGTNRNSLHSDREMQQNMAQLKFDRIREVIAGKPYDCFRHVPFVAVDTSNPSDPVIKDTRKKIYNLMMKQSHMGQEIPARWCQFDKILHRLTNKHIFYSDLQTVGELAREVDIESETELRTVLQFYHSLGLILFWGGDGCEVLENTVIFSPGHLIALTSRLTSSLYFNKFMQSSCPGEPLYGGGVVDVEAVSLVCAELHWTPAVALRLLEALDVLVTTGVTTNYKDFGSSTDTEPMDTYLIPSLLTEENHIVFNMAKEDLVYFINVSPFMPESVFHLLTCGLIHWCRANARCKEEPKAGFRSLLLSIDECHQVYLEMQPLRYNRIKVVIKRTPDIQTSPTRQHLLPSPKVCHMMRSVIESNLNSISRLWLPKLRFEAGVRCCCNKACRFHKIKDCGDQNCVHFLSLDRCLTSTVIWCDYCKVHTSFIRKYFPQEFMRDENFPYKVIVPNINSLGPFEEICAKNLLTFDNENQPTWIKGVAKLLESGKEGEDWRALGNLLGYKISKLDEFEDTLNPGYHLLCDWFTSSSNTTLSNDMILSCLDELNRQDIVNIIREEEEDLEQPSIFISYQWDSQKEVFLLRQFLEERGFSCWMDVGQMGGGDQLYHRIYDGISGCKVVVCCVSPKLSVSDSCIKEMSLADLLRKPILPVMVTKTPWPPPGPLALIMATLVYVDMAGTGGHGGTGAHADWQARANEVVLKLNALMTPKTTPTNTQKKALDRAMEVAVVGMPGSSSSSLSGVSSPRIGPPTPQEVPAQVVTLPESSPSNNSPGWRRLCNKYCIRGHCVIS